MLMSVLPPRGKSTHDAHTANGAPPSVAPQNYNPPTSRRRRRSWSCRHLDPVQSAHHHHHEHTADIGNIQRVSKRDARGGEFKGGDGRRSAVCCVCVVRGFAARRKNGHQHQERIEGSMGLELEGKRAKLDKRPNMNCQNA